MDIRLDILIADRGGKIGKAVEASLRAHGLSVEVLDESAVVNDEPGYIRLLKRKVEECRPRLAMPIFKGEWVARHAEEIDCAAPVAPADTIAILDDKVKCSELCSRLGIRQPGMYSDEEVSRIKEWPVVFKRADGLSGSSVYFPKDRKALENLIRSSRKPHLTMDFIEGYDCSVDAIRWPMADGSVFWSAMAYRVIFPRRKGISSVRLGTVRKDLEETARRILDAVDYKGVCGLDFRISRQTGEAFFLECNPRFSGGIRSSLTAGLDLPFLLWKLANGERPSAPKLRTHRLSIDFDTLLERK